MVVGVYHLGGNSALILNNCEVSTSFCAHVSPGSGKGGGARVVWPAGNPSPTGYAVRAAKT